MEQNEDDEEQLHFEIQNHDSDAGYDEEFIPETIEQEVRYDIYHLNCDQLSANMIHTSPLYSNIDYLEAFIKHVTCKSDVTCRKAIPKTLNSLRIPIGLHVG